MGIRFDGTNYLYRNSAVITGGQATFAGWFYLFSSSDLCYGPGVLNSAGTGFWHIRHAPGEGWGAAWYGSAMIAYRIHNTPSTVGWHYVAGLFPSDNTQIPYLFVDGVEISGITATGAGTLTPDTTTIQRNYFSGAGYNGTGICAEQAIWNTHITASELSALCNGACAIQIKPQNLVAYWPLGGRYQRSGNDMWKNGHNLTLSGSLIEADHPRIRYPKPFSTTKYTYVSSGSILYASIPFDVKGIISQNASLTINSAAGLNSISRINSSYNRIMNSRIDLPNDIIISSSSNKVINGVGIFSGNVDISTTYKRIMSGNSVLSSITELSDFPSLIINPQLSFQNKNSITGIGSLLINGGTIPLNTSSDLNLTIQRILNPNITIDTTSTTNNVGSLIISGYSSINSNSNISPSTTRIISSVINLMNDGYLDNNPYITINAIQKFISEENLTIIPSLIFNSRVGIENISEFNSIPTRIISSNQTIQSKSSIQNICSLIMSGVFGADGDSIFDGNLTSVDTGQTLLGTSILQTLSHLGLNASLRMEGSVDLGNDLNTFLSSNRIILPVVELRNNTSIEYNPHSIINSVVDMEAFGRLSPASQRIINGRFEVGSQGRIIGNSSRIIQSELELNAYTEFLNSSTRIHTGMLVLSNDSSFDSSGNRVISGVMVYDIDSYINSAGQSVLTGQLNLQTSTLLDSSIIKLVFIPFTMNICKEYDINLQNSTTKTFQFSINREKEVVLNIRK